jgi:hypothetical protein
VQNYNITYDDKYGQLAQIDVARGTRPPCRLASSLNKSVEARRVGEVRPSSGTTASIQATRLGARRPTGFSGSALGRPRAGRA